MTLEFDYEYDETWVLCSKCHELVTNVKYTPGAGAVCKSCQS
jgi:formylmethanofuran dehydrogenase subunit E